MLFDLGLGLSYSGAEVAFRPEYWSPLRCLQIGDVRCMFRIGITLSKQCIQRLLYIQLDGFRERERNTLFCSDSKSRVEIDGAL